MLIQRKPASNPSVDMSGQCVGCQDCKGVCQTLLELMTFPETVLKRSRPA